MNFTITFFHESGEAIFMFPASKSLADWNTYRVELVEQSAPDEGKYVGTINTSEDEDWLVYPGSAQPSANDFIAVWSLPAIKMGRPNRWTNVGKGSGYDDVIVSDIT